MECPNCTFQNTPGLPVCVRCQSRLDLTDIEVTPPRASGSLVVRSSRRWSWRVKAAAQYMGRSATATARNAIPREVCISELLWSVVPGRGQVRHGHRVLGMCILVGWAVFILLAAMNAGSPSGYFFVFSAIGVHCFGVSLVLAPALRDMHFGHRLLAGIATWLLLVGVIYWPASRLLGNVFALTPIEEVRESRIMERGDVLLSTGPWTRPESIHRGDIVMYRIRGFTMPAVIVREGVGIDRVIGLPGDRVEIRKGRLTVNGEPPSEQFGPLGSTKSLPDTSISVGEGQCVVLPSLAAWYQHGQVNTGAMMQRVSTISNSDVLGRVLGRLRPWSRLTRFERVGGT
jgi:hypothetical protein